MYRHKKRPHTAAATTVCGSVNQKVNHKNMIIIAHASKENKLDLAAEHMKGEAAS